MNVRNKNGYWVNPQVFREPANHFTKYGYYCDSAKGTQEWYDYWDNERKNCISGVTRNGVSITGEHYFYLNFSNIPKVADTDSKTSYKKEGFPDFWDGDYDYFWVRHIAKHGLLTLLNPTKRKKLLNLSDKDQLVELEKLRDELHLFSQIPSHEIYDNKIIHFLKGGYNLVVGKGRRKGFSHKNSSIAVYNFFTRPGEVTLLNTYGDDFLFGNKGIMGMTLEKINFINKYTAWAMPSDAINKSDHIRASHIVWKNGIKVEEGFMSEINAYTCAKKPDKNRGAGATEIMIDECGIFGPPGHLKKVYDASVNCVKEGKIKIGMITVFGTSNNVEGKSPDYADMYMRPLAYDMLPVKNIWDENTEDQFVGYFFPMNMNMKGFIDNKGNSDFEKAKDFILNERQYSIDKGNSAMSIQRLQCENPLNPSDAFTSSNFNNFPVIELKRQLKIIEAGNLQKIKGKPVDMYYSNGKVIMKPIIDSSKYPILRYPDLSFNKEGCPVIYEWPIDNAPAGLYKIGYDPVMQDHSGTSLAGIVVYKSVYKHLYNHSNIVAEYIGRKELVEDIDRIAEMFAVAYNTKVMYENQIMSVTNYFKHKNKLHLLALQPDNVISKAVKNSKVARVFGCHMSKEIKYMGETYIKSWLLKELDVDENGNQIIVIDKLYSTRLIEELIAYNETGNFDLVSALIMCLIQVKEEEEKKKVYDIDKKKNPNIQYLIDNIKNMYKKNTNYYG